MAVYFKFIAHFPSSNGAINSGNTVFCYLVLKPITADDLLLMCYLLLINVHRRTSSSLILCYFSYTVESLVCIYEAILLLETGITSSAKNFYIRLALVELYKAIGQLPFPSL